MALPHASSVIAVLCVLEMTMSESLPEEAAGSHFSILHMGHATRRCTFLIVVYSEGSFVGFFFLTPFFFFSPLLFSFLFIFSRLWIWLWGLNFGPKYNLMVVSLYYPRDFDLLEFCLSVLKGRFLFNFQCPFFMCFPFVPSILSADLNVINFKMPSIFHDVY